MNPNCYGNCWQSCKCASCDCQWQCEKDTVIETENYITADKTDILFGGKANERIRWKENL